MLFFGKKMTESPDKHVLVIGGGIAGLSAITGLRQNDKKVKITLVDAKDYCEIFWSSYRSPFDENVAKQSLVRLPKYCAANDVEFVQATVTKLSKTNCQVSLMVDGRSTDTTPAATTTTTATNKTIDFDVCVLATGANAPWKGMGRDLPTTVDTAKAESRLVAMKHEGRRLINAKSVVIVGGGLIGTELAGDLAAYSKKAEMSPDITLVHNGEFLCNSHMSPAAGKAVQDQLEGLDVKVILKEKANETSPGKVMLTNSNKYIDADVIIKTTGFVAVNNFVKDAFPDALDDRGWIKTDEYFVVPGSDGKVFAYGDCSPTLPNAGNVYFRSCGLLGHNIQVTLTGSDNVSMKPAAKLFIAVINTVGPEKGVFYMDNGFWGRRFLPWVKNKTMFFMSPKSMLGIKDEWKLSKE